MRSIPRFPAICVFVLLAASGCKVSVTSDSPSPTTSGKPSKVKQAAPGDLARHLKDLPLAAAPHPQGYTRAQFGPAWKDVDHNGCDTRNDILARDLTDVVKRGRCVVLSGTLHDPYTGTTMHFVRGPQSALIQIDHIYPEHRAWMYGAWKWTLEQRENFGNDPLELVAANGKANEAKGDDGPADWTPDQGFWCQYATRYIQVAVKYHLPVTGADRDKLGTMIKRC